MLKGLELGGDAGLDLGSERVDVFVYFFEKDFWDTAGGHFGEKTEVKLVMEMEDEAKVKVILAEAR